MGKTPEQLEWAHHVSQHTGKPVLLIAPLGVTLQTVRESEKFNRQIKYIRLKSEIDAESAIINYEMLKNFIHTAGWYGGVVFDESSIFKGLGSKTYKLAKELVRAFLNARFTAEARHVRRLAKIVALENERAGSSNRRDRRMRE